MPTPAPAAASASRSTPRLPTLVLATLAPFVGLGGLASVSMGQSDASVAPSAVAAPAEGAPDPAGPGRDDLRDATRPTRTQPASDRAFNLTFRPRAEHTFEADLRDSDGATPGGGGSVATTRAGAGLGLGVPISERARILVNAEAEFSRYEWAGVSGLLPSGRDPIRDAYLVRISPGMVYGLNADWSLTGGAIVEIAAAEDADFGDAVTYGGFFGARYRWSENLTSTFGIIAKTRLEDSAIFVPLLGVEWRITDRVRLENEGLGLKLTADLNERWRAGVFARYELRDYRLADAEDGGSVSEGVLRDSRVPVGVSLEWRPGPATRIELLGGVVVHQRYEIEDDRGDRVESDRAEPAPFIGLTGTIAF